MSLSESDFHPTPNYPIVFLDQLYRDQTASGLPALSYLDTCNRATIPSEVRGALLRALLNFGYIDLDGGDLVQLTESGRRIAAAPLN